MPLKLNEVKAKSKTFWMKKSTMKLQMPSLLPVYTIAARVSEYISINVSSVNDNTCSGGASSC